MSNQPPERIPYTMISGPAYVFFNKDYHLTQFLGALAVHTTNGLRPFVPLIVDLVLCRAVDNYLAYIGDLLALVYATTPGRKTPSKLSHSGISQKHEYLKAQLKFPLFETEADLERAGRIVETRNLFTHNRGIISPRFLGKVPGFKGTAGEPIQLPLEGVGDDLTFLQGSVRNIDFRAGRTFKIPRTLPLFGAMPPKPAQ
jgi:hypothetical protein